MTPDAQHTVMVAIRRATLRRTPVYPEPPAPVVHQVLCLRIRLAALSEEISP